MITLSFYVSYEFAGHDINLALVKDNKILYSFEEQKLSKTLQKETKFFPDRTLINCFKTTGIKPSEIDNFCLVGPNKINRTIASLYWSAEKYFGIKKNINHVCPHHVAHSYYSVLTSNFKECIFWTLDDGGADNNYGEFGIFKNGKFKVLHKILNPSLPKFYYHITGACGFSDFEEGKIMGLSGYGNFQINLYEEFTKLFKFDKIGNIIYKWDEKFSYPEIDLSKYNANQHRPFRIIKYLNRNIFNKLKQMTSGYLPQDIAKTAQVFCEDYSSLSLRKMLDFYKLSSNNLALGGGLFLNILINKKIKNDFKFNIFVPPGVNDMTLAIGGGLWANTRKKKQIKNIDEKVFSPFKGPSYTNEEVKEELDNFNLDFKKLSDKKIQILAAKDIANGKVIGWFQGRGEIGPRALGARSVLADPRKKDSKARVNLLLKKRDWFMPYAPSILEEDADDFLKDYKFSPYMNTAFDVKKEKISLIPSAVHVDGTLRPNIVNNNFNSKYYKLIKEFKKLTKIPCVLNTSFNKHGVPIVSTPRDALIHLIEGMIDYLYIENYRVRIKNKKIKKNIKVSVDETIREHELIARYFNLLFKNKEFKNINLILKRNFNNIKIIKNKNFLYILNKNKKIILNGYNLSKYRS
jgi:carbamoyltransferase